MGTQATGVYDNAMIAHGCCFESAFGRRNPSPPPCSAAPGAGSLYEWRVTRSEPGPEHLINEMATNQPSGPLKANLGTSVDAETGIEARTNGTPVGFREPPDQAYFPL